MSLRNLRFLVPVMLVADCGGRSGLDVISSSSMANGGMGGDSSVGGQGGSQTGGASGGCVMATTGGTPSSSMATICGSAVCTPTSCGSIIDACGNVIDCGFAICGKEHCGISVPNGMSARVPYQQNLQRNELRNHVRQLLRNHRLRFYQLRPVETVA